MCPRGLIGPRPLAWRRSLAATELARAHLAHHDAAAPARSRLEPWRTVTPRPLDMMPFFLVARSRRSADLMRDCVLCAASGYRCRIHRAWGLVVPRSRRGWQRTSLDDRGQGFVAHGGAEPRHQAATKGPALASPDGERISTNHHDKRKSMQSLSDARAIYSSQCAMDTVVQRGIQCSGANRGV